MKVVKVEGQPRSEEGLACVGKKYAGSLKEWQAQLTIKGCMQIKQAGEYEPGQQLKLDEIFKVGDLVDVAGVSMGKGFQGKKRSPKPNFLHSTKGPAFFESKLKLLISHKILSDRPVNCDITPGKIGNAQHLHPVQFPLAMHFHMCLNQPLQCCCTLWTSSEPPAALIREEEYWEDCADGVMYYARYHQKMGHGKRTNDSWL